MTEKTTITDNRSGPVRVLEAVHALYEQEMEITSASLVRHTGLKSVTVAECLKTLKQLDDIWSPERGIYRPCQRHEQSEAISITVMPTGHVKLEKGDQVMAFNPHEWRTQVAPVAAGAAAQTAVIEHTHQTLQLADMVRRLRRQVEGLQSKLGANPAQMELL